MAIRLAGDRMLLSSHALGNPCIRIVAAEEMQGKSQDKANSQVVSSRC
jgi:hypothetical protein